MRLVLDPDEVSARTRCVPLHGRRAGVLRDRRAHTVTVGVKHIAPSGKGEEGVEVARGDRLIDRKGVAAGWHRHPYPVEEHTWVDVVDHPVANAVIHAAEGLGSAAREVSTSRCCRRDLTHLNGCGRRRWSRRRRGRCCSSRSSGWSKRGGGCRGSSSRSCRCECSCSRWSKCCSGCWRRPRTIDEVKLQVGGQRSRHVALELRKV